MTLIFIAGKAMLRQRPHFGERIEQVLRGLTIGVFVCFGLGILYLRSLPAPSEIERALQKPWYIVAIRWSATPDWQIVFVEDTQESIFEHTAPEDRPIWAIYGPTKVDHTRSTSTPLSDQQREAMNDWRTMWCSEPRYLRKPNEQEMYYDIAMRCNGFPASKRFLIPAEQLPADIQQIVSVASRTSFR
jgi:hypothetical protein